MAAKEDAGLRPDFILKGYARDGSMRTPRLGAAWLNPNGHISIRIDPFVVLTENKEFTFMLYPNKKENEGDSED